MEKEDTNLKTKTNTNKTTLIFIVLFAVSTIVLGWLYYQEHQRVTSLLSQVDDTNKEKEDLTLSFNDLSAEYEDLKTNNDTINAKLAKEQERIAELVSNLKKIKSASRFQIAQYKKELGTLREIMKSFIVQIDSLNTLNENLTAENVKVKTEYQRARVTNKELSDKNQNLVDIVDIASIIKLRGLIATPINSKGKTMSKAHKTDKIKINFTLEKNDIAKAGKRLVYIRIARPDESVLTPQDEDLFTYQGNKVIYSAKREVEYNSDDTNMSIYWKKNDELTSGEYTVDVFIDGNMIGITKFTLK